MGLYRRPPNRADLIKQHLTSMRSYAVELKNFFPLISRKSVQRRIDKCADDLETAHFRISELERRLKGF